MPYTTTAGAIVFQEKHTHPMGDVAQEPIVRPPATQSRSAVSVGPSGPLSRDETPLHSPSELLGYWVESRPCPASNRARDGSVHMPFSVPRAAAAAKLGKAVRAVLFAALAVAMLPALGAETLSLAEWAALSRAFSAL